MRDLRKGCANMDSDTESLKPFVWLFWFSLCASGVMGVWWFIMARRRETWVGWTDAEAHFWRRTKMPVWIIDHTNRIEKSRALTIYVGTVCVLFLLLTVFNAWAYLHFEKGSGDRTPPIPAVKSAD